MLVQCKRREEDETYSLTTIEKQPLEFCKEHIRYHEDVDFVYAATA